MMETEARMLSPEYLTGLKERPIDEVRAHLESLVRKEVAEIEVTDSGQFVYSFPGFLTADQKDDAKGLLEG